MKVQPRLPEFSEYGVLPPGIHYTGLDEFKTKLGFNSCRKEMIEQGLTPVLKELRDKKVLD